MARDGSTHTLIRITKATDSRRESDNWSSQNAEIAISAIIAVLQVEYAIIRSFGTRTNFVQIPLPFPSLRGKND